MIISLGYIVDKEIDKWKNCILVNRTISYNVSFAEVIVLYVQIYIDIYFLTKFTAFILRQEENRRSVRNRQTPQLLCGISIHNSKSFNMSTYYVLAKIRNKQIRKLCNRKITETQEWSQTSTNIADLEYSERNAIYGKVLHPFEIRKNNCWMMYILCPIRMCFDVKCVLSEAKPFGSARIPNA